MKLLMLTNVCARGGAENQIILLLQKLAALKQFEVSAAFFEVRDQALAESLRAAGVTVYDLKTPQKLSFKPLWALQKLIRSQSFDVVHSHLSYPDWVIAHIHKRYPKFKLIHTIHNCESIFKFWPVQWFYRFLLNREFSWSICISKAVREQVTRYLKIPQSRSNVIYYGYEPSGASASTQKQSHSLELLFLARLVPQKNHLFLFHTLAELKDQPIRVKLAGAGRKSYENYLKAQVHKLGIESMVEFVGQVADPTRLMQNCDALILTSKWEGFGLVLLEAMAVAKPVIATDIAPINEVVLPETGWLVSQNDVPALKNILETALANRAQLTQKGQAGLLRLSQNFSVQRMVSEFLGIIR